MRKAQFSIIAVVAGLALATGCTPSDPPPTPPAESTGENEAKKVSAPTSETEAVDDAYAAYENFLTVQGEIFADPSQVEKIDGLATDELVELEHQVAEDLTELGQTGRGAPNYEFEAGTANTLELDGEVIPFGTVNLEGCYSTEDWTVTRADGTEPERHDVQRFKKPVTMTWNPKDERWIVYRNEAPEPLVEC